MVRSLSLRRGFSWTALGNTVYAAAQWGNITALAKLGSPEMVGIFALALAVTTPIFQFLGLQLRGVQATDAKSDFHHAEYFTLRLITTAVALLATLGSVFVAQHDERTAAVVIIVGFAKGADALSDVIYGMFQRRERMDIVSQSLILNGLLSLLLMSFTIWLTNSLALGSLAYAAGSVFTLLFHVIPAAGRTLDPQNGVRAAVQLGWSWSRIVRLGRVALPLGITMLFISLNANIPRYYVEHELGSYALGIFAAMSYLLVAGTTVVSALGQVISPRLSQLFAVGNVSAFAKILAKMMSLGMVIGLAGALLSSVLGPTLLTLLYTPEYAGYSNVLVVLALGAGFSFAASFAGYGMTAARYFNVQVPLFLFVLLSGLLASIVLIPRLGLMGAALSLMVVAIVQLSGQSAVVLYAIRARRGTSLH